MTQGASSRRGMVVALAVTALGAVLVLATAGQPRWSAGRGQLGSDGAPAATALALVALAGIGLLLLLSGPARSVIGVLLVLAGAAVVLVDVLDVQTGSVGFVTYSPVAGNQLELHRSVWFWLTAAGGVVLGAGGLLVAIRGHRWPGTRRDYRAPAEPDVVRRDAWTALDRGEDPTA